MNSTKSFFLPNVFDSVKVEFHQFADLDALAFNEEKISSKKLEIRVENLAELIKSKIQEEKFIEVSCARSIQTIVSIFAVLYPSKAYLPIDFDLPGERLQMFYSETKVKFGLPGNSHKSFDSLAVTDINNTLLDKENTDIVLAEQGYIIFTPSSTGVSRGIAIPHGALINFMELQNENSISGQGINTLHFANLTFDISLQGTFTALSTGGTLYIIEKSTIKDAFLSLEFVEKNEIIQLFFPSIVLQGLCNESNAYRIYPKSLKEIMTVGEQFKVCFAVSKFFKNMEGFVLLNHYNPTETTITINELRLIGDPDQWGDLPTIGKEMANSDLVLVNEEGKLINEPAVIGEICISGIGSEIGYFNNPTWTSERCVEVSYEGNEAKRYFKTRNLTESDLVIYGTLDSSGSQISILDERCEWLDHLNLKKRLNSQGLDQSSRNLGIYFKPARHPSSGRNLYQLRGAMFYDRFSNF